MMKRALVTTLFAVFTTAGTLDPHLSAHLSAHLSVHLSAHLSAQEAPSVELTEEALTTYAEAHVEFGAARDAFQLRLGLTHEVQERARLRAQLAETVAAILEEHELLREEYDRITTLISVDQALRERFEALLATLKAGGEARGPSA